MRKLTITLTLLLVAAGALWCADKDSIADLKARAEKESGNKQIELYLEVAKRQIELSDQLYTAGDVEKAKACVLDATEAAVRAGRLSLDTGKRLKQTEIALRKLGERMEAIRRTLSLDDRPVLQDSENNVEVVRSKLLDRMFKR